MQRESREQRHGAFHVAMLRAYELFKDVIPALPRQGFLQKTEEKLLQPFPPFFFLPWGWGGEGESMFSHMASFRVISFNC